MIRRLLERLGMHRYPSESSRGKRPLEELRSKQEAEDVTEIERDTERARRELDEQWASVKALGIRVDLRRASETEEHGNEQRRAS